ncbi:hypothetical protein [Bartonella queenslandensis]|uniref:hypothetical protein n=1 Tax=Bartonella queenslandensis TaxID=481138 RepID=UPI0002F9E083|nr:hypothetical protein [Bartonella queenslandensis]
MELIAKISLQTPDGLVQPSAIIKLDDTDANALIARGFAEPIGQEMSIKTPENNERDADILSIMDAIAVLDASGFGKDGKPLVKALKDLLDRDVSQEQRDEAWERYQQGKEL